MSFLGGSASVSSGYNQQELDAAKANTNAAYAQQKALVDMLNKQNMGAYAGQNALAGQLQQQALGQGPNPAQAMLAQATAQNVAQQNAMMAGQRGTSANAGLIGRQAAMQGANIQQNAALQGATMQAQQQLAAQQQLQQLYGTQAGQLQGGIGMQNQLAQNQQNMIGSAISGANMQNAKHGAGLMGGLLGAAGTAVGAYFGGPWGATAGSALGKGAGSMLESAGANTGSSGMGFFGLAHGGAVPHPSGCASMVGQHFHNMMSGGHVPGQASVAGDSLKNDTVPAMLSPGEVVLPRTVVNSPNPQKAAADFVAAIMARKGK